MDLYIYDCEGSRYILVKRDIENVEEVYRKAKIDTVEILLDNGALYFEEFISRLKIQADVDNIDIPEDLIGSIWRIEYVNIDDIINFNSYEAQNMAVIFIRNFSPHF